VKLCCCSARSAAPPGRYREQDHELLDLLKALSEALCAKGRCGIAQIGIESEFSVWWFLASLRPFLLVPSFNLRACLGRWTCPNRSWKKKSGKWPNTEKFSIVSKILTLLADPMPARSWSLAWSESGELALADSTRSLLHTLIMSESPDIQPKKKKKTQLIALNSKPSASRRCPLLHRWPDGTCA